MPWGWVIGVAIGVCMIVAGFVWVHVLEWARRQEREAVLRARARRS